MYVKIIDLNISEVNGSTYFSITTIDNMEQPEETFKFDSNNKVDYKEWQQDRYPNKNNEPSAAKILSK